MAVNIPNLNVNAIGDGLQDRKNYEAILDILQRYRKELNFYLMNLDLDNMPAVAESIDWIHQDIDGVKITVGNNAGDIAALNITAGQIQSSVADLNTYTNEQIALIDGEIITINTTISDQYSSITQRADAIEADVGNVVTSVSTLGTTVTQNHTNITQRAASIESTVSSITSDINDLDGDVALAYSQISQLATDITAKVTIGEVTNYLSINQAGVQINASNIDLTGVTTIYGNDGYTRMGGRIKVLVSPYDNAFR